MKITISLDLEEVLKKPVDEIDDEDQEVIEKAKEDLPRKVVKLEKDEGMVDPGTNAKPLKYTVKKGDTLKSISDRFFVSYGELSNHLMNTEGTTSIHEGMELEIPRHFVDLTKAE